MRARERKASMLSVSRSMEKKRHTRNVCEMCRITESDSIKWRKGKWNW